MHTHRFGRKLKLPSTVAIKHGILKLMLQDHLKAQALGVTAVEDLDMVNPGSPRMLDTSKKTAPTSVQLF